MTAPRFSVSWSRRLEDGQDELGNDTEAYAGPERIAVSGWAAPDPAVNQAGHDFREVVHVQLYAPVFPVSRRDRVELGGVAHIVVGVADWGKGPYGFEPGIVVDLRRSEG